jgi:hypothetical protein
MSALQQTDSPSTCPISNWGGPWGLANTTATRLMQPGGVPGTATFNAGWSAAAPVGSEGIIVQWQSTELGREFWPSGTWTVDLVVTAGNPRLAWTELWLYRVSQSCTLKMQLVSVTVGPIALATGGTYTVAATAPMTVGAMSDSVVALIVARKVAAGSGLITIKPNGMMETPMDRIVGASGPAFGNAARPRVAGVIARAGVIGQAVNTRIRGGIV